MLDGYFPVDFVYAGLGEIDLLKGVFIPFYRLIVSGTIAVQHGGLGQGAEAGLLSGLYFHLRRSYAHVIDHVEVLADHIFLFLGHFDHVAGHAASMP